MAQLICPDCKVSMEEVKEPDITMDKCPDCKGVFLHKGELNALATGLAGNIEYCSIDKDFHQDKFPTRVCPVCPGQEMRKINLLRLSDLIFDYCPKCEGFYLDRNETQQINAELQKMAAEKGSQKYRKHIDGHLIRIDELKDAVIVGAPLGLFSKPAEIMYIQVSVYYRKPLDVKLHISEEEWTAKLSKMLGLFKDHDIQSGNPDFDKSFVVHADNEKKALEILSPEYCKAMVEFVKNKQKILTETGKIEVSDKVITYTEGPYKPDAAKDLDEKSEPTVKALLELASLLEA
ncbi:zf-TFIIB domain-containing protein [Verrucomicrobiota bacterium]